MEELREFLVVATTHGYAANGENKTKKEEDRSKSTWFTSGVFTIHDNWFGGEPFGGREVVWKEQKPYWMMVYYGSDSGKAPGLIPFLLEALKATPQDLPVRGPKMLTQGGFRYENTWQGTLESFFGEEKIYFQNQEVYSAKYQGGLVDQRGDQ